MTRSISVVKTSYTKSASEAKASVRYMQHRQSDQGEHTARQLFGKHGEWLNRQEAYERLDRAAEAEGRTYFYRLVLNPGEGHADLSEEGRQAWASQVMGRIEDQGVKVRDWVAVSHTDQGEHDHLHVLAATSRTLQKAELADLRTYSREAYEGQREMQQELGLYRDDSGGGARLVQEYSYEEAQQRPQQRSYDMDY